MKLYILRGAKVEQKQRQRNLEFVNSIFPPLCWLCSYCWFWIAPWLRKTRWGPTFYKGHCYRCRDTASIAAEWVERVKKKRQLAPTSPRLLLRFCSPQTCIVASRVWSVLYGGTRKTKQKFRGLILTPTVSAQSRPIEQRSGFRNHSNFMIPS